MLDLLAQTAPDLPSWQWWANYGVLGIGGFIMVTALCAFFFAAWLPNAVASYRQDRAHREKKQASELLRDQKLTAFIDTLSETHGQEVEHKRVMAATLERMDRRQAEHAHACDETHQLTVEIARNVADLKARSA